MALGTPVAAAAAYSAASGTTVAPAYPTGILTTDAVVLFVGQKPTAVGGGTVTTPTGWTLRDELTNAGGYAAQGADSGNTNLRVYTWNAPVAGQTGNLTVTIAGNDVTWAYMLRVPTGGGTLSYGSADGQRTTTPTSPMSIALTNGASATNFQNGDLALWAMCIPTDVTTPAQFSAQSITATGATFATAVEINEPDSGTGNDIGGYSARALVTAGSSTAAPTVTVTLAGTLTNVRGPVVLLRVREAALTPVTGDLNVTEVGSDTFSAAGSVPVAGDLAAVEEGADAFAASGTVSDAVITGALAATEGGTDTLTADGDVIVQGSLSVTEAGADILAASGSVLVQGSLSVAEVGADTLTASGVVIVQGSLSVTETGADSFAAAGAALAQGALSSTETGADVFSAAGELEAARVEVSWLQVEASVGAGSLAATEAGSDTLAAAGAALAQGSLSATEAAADTFASTGSVRAQGSLAATESGADVFSAAGAVVAAGALAASESGADTFAAAGAALAQGSLTAAEAGQDTFFGSSSQVASGSLAVVEVGADTLTAAGAARVQGSLAATEAGADTFSGSGAVGAIVVQGLLAATEVGSDTTYAWVQDGYAFEGYAVPGFVGTVAPVDSFGPPDWKYRVNTGGGPIGPFTVQRKRRRLAQQEDAPSTVDPWDAPFLEVALAEDAEISEFLLGLVSSGVLDGHV